MLFLSVTNSDLIVQRHSYISVPSISLNRDIIWFDGYYLTVMKKTQEREEEEEDNHEEERRLVRRRLVFDDDDAFVNINNEITREESCRFVLS